MFAMRKLVVPVLIVLAACGPTPTVAPTVAIAPNESLPTATPQSVTPTVMVMPAVTDTSEASEFWLQIFSPLDEAVVNTPQVDVTGSAPAGAVVSVAEQILIVDSGQQFTATVPLEEGPNLIEIIASDEHGNEMSVLLTVTYEP